MYEHLPHLETSPDLDTSARFRDTCLINRQLPDLETPAYFVGTHLFEKYPLEDIDANRI